MSSIYKSTIRTEVYFSEGKKKAMVIMINPSLADDRLIDPTTMYVINNLSKLDFGSVEILNIYSKINAKTFAEMEEDEEAIKTNDTHIEKAAAQADTIVLAWGSGCDTSKKASERQKNVLKLLEKHKDKLVVIEDEIGCSGFHPLAPQVRHNWELKKIDLK